MLKILFKFVKCTPQFWPALGWEWASFYRFVENGTFLNPVRDLNALEFEACESGAKFLTKTSTDLTYEVLVELVEETVADVSFSAAVIANAAATMEISQGSK